MPHIDPELRYQLRPSIRSSATTSGELNFQLTTVLLDYLEFHGETYATHNDIMGALEGAKLEWYRCNVAPYEDRKIAENGSVFA